MKKFIALAAMFGQNCARNGVDAYGRGDLLLWKEYQEAELVDTTLAAGIDRGAAVTDETTRSLLSMRKNKPLLEVLSLQQAEQAEKKDHKKKDHKKKDHKKKDHKKTSQET